ncbi:hypothetical protein [Leptolyngbya sp. NIES-2104]|nr:hypothetical protein [Leptolyngbya sp. NIES-2104]
MQFNSMTSVNRPSKLFAGKLSIAVLSIEQWCSTFTGGRMP